ncbi:MAG: hypothetical protein GVY22_03745 [Gammaproteobacteria bacterium]|nr:hypothetical protein [Gammaproteobacteria bacterium]
MSTEDARFEARERVLAIQAVLQAIREHGGDEYTLGLAKAASELADALYQEVGE